MNKLLALAVLVIVTTTAQAQDGKGLARVQRIDGVEAYFMSEPINDYDVVFDVTTGLKATSVITGGLINEGVSEKASQYVKRAIKEAKKDGHEFDAIIYSSGKRIVAVKFKQSDPQTKMIARVNKIDGVEIYVLAEPLAAYEVANKKGGGFKMKSALTGGLVNNSIEEDVAQFVKKLAKDAEKDNIKLDGIIYSAGKNATGIQFK
jgi:hypothetical protein